MATTDRQDQAQFWRPRFVSGAELVSVAYRGRSFPEHSHAEYVIGAVTEGAETLTLDGLPYIVAAGSVLRLHPDETHANSTVGTGMLRYEVLYLPEPAIRPYLDQDGPPCALAFAEPIVHDRSLYETVREAHARLASNAGQLEQESAMSTLVRTIASGGSPITRRSPASPTMIALARDYIDHHFADAFGLQTLSGLTGLSVFHLVRSFKRTVGLSPLAYRNQKRVVAARAMLLDGAPIAQVALSVGYADQSHLTRHFQRIVGVPPGRYAQQ